MIRNEIQEHLRNVSSILNKHKVEYIVVGGAAVNYYGNQRLSKVPTHPEFKVDLDFWYNPTIQNFQNLLAALSELQVDTVWMKRNMSPAPFHEEDVAPLYYVK